MAMFELLIIKSTNRMSSYEPWNRHWHWLVMLIRLETLHTIIHLQLIDWYLTHWRLAAFTSLLLQSCC